METPACLSQEQSAIVEAAVSGRSLKVEALAGTGKTFTMRQVAFALPDRKKSLYLAFNTTTAAEARKGFPPWMTVKTGHALAMAAVGYKYRDRLTTNGWQLKTEIEAFLRPQLRQVAHSDAMQYNRYLFATLDVLRNFQYSADVEITPTLVPREYLPFCNPARVADLAWMAWSELASLDSTMCVSHDTYLKVYQLANRPIDAQTIIVDEMQDTNPVMLGILKAQEHAQVIGVGDESQQIYQFRCAVNALAQLTYDTLPLTQSWRFGRHIAAVANLVLDAKKAALRVEGHGPLGTVVEYSDQLPTAVITRTNAGLVAEALQLFNCQVVDAGVERPVRLAILGGADAVANQVLGAYELYERGRSKHPNFHAFATWFELRQAVETVHASALRPFVTLVEKYLSQVPEICARLRRETVAPNSADIILSTAHKFKGGESARVRISDDFGPFAIANPQTREITFLEDEANLAYVALTRAKTQLQLAGYRQALAESLRLATILNQGGTHDQHIQRSA